ncbi:MAG: hypothetical protein JWR84_686 [Caulobacter sp.]|nr:hypothetical protein [Caulobacter sp.]
MARQEISATSTSEDSEAPATNELSTLQFGPAPHVWDELVDAWIRKSVGGQSRLFRQPLFSLTLSTFLKLAMLPAKQAKQEIRNRLQKLTNPYDRYRVLRYLIGRIVIAGMPLSEVRRRIRRIKKWDQRRDTRSGILRFLRWLRAKNVSVGFWIRAVKWTSPNHLFSVTVRPETGYFEDGILRALFTYNTRDPFLDETFAKIGCQLAEEAFAQAGQTKKYDHEVLALQATASFTAPDHERETLAADLHRHVARIEYLILEVIEELEAPGPR